MTVKSDENDEIFIIQYLIWLGFQILQFFKVIYLGPQASDWLISINLWS